MPLYEYQCGACGHLLEVIEKVTDDTTRECPECEGTMERLLSSPAIRFKGSGWYITDYARRDGSGSKESEDSPKKSAESGTSDTSASTSSGESSSGGSGTKAPDKKGD